METAGLFLTLRQHDERKRFALNGCAEMLTAVRDLLAAENALVLCVDEKSQIQALDRTQTVLPMRPGRIERRTHDYVRHGVTSLFAALNVATGEVIGQCHQRHRAKEFLAFLARVDREVPAKHDVHVVLDNYATHKTPSVKRWLAKHPRFVFHFTPTGSSWRRRVVGVRFPAKPGMFNSLFVGSDRGGSWAATMFSIMQSCWLVDLDPYRYLVDVFAQLHQGRTDYDQLRPKAWQQRSRTVAA